jgi:hypothetical protein
MMNFRRLASDMPTISANDLTAAIRGKRRSSQDSKGDEVLAIADEVIE